MLDETVLVILPNVGKITIKDALDKGLLESIILETLICPVCDEEFTAYPSDNRKYCSPECSQIAQKGKTYEEQFRIRKSGEKRETIICPTCEEEFTALVSEKRKYCSPECCLLDRKGKTNEEIFGVEKAREISEKISKIKKGVVFTPEHCANLSKGTTKRFEDPKEVEKMIQSIKKAYENHPEYGEEASKIAKKRWNNLTPEERENQLRNGLYKGRRSPNLSEAKLIPMLEPLGFQYNGNGPVIINGKTPDFIHETLPLFIEYDGEGGHDPNNPRVPENQPQLDDQRDIGYRKAGRHVLRLLPEDLWEGKEHVQNKVKEWMDSLHRGA